MQNITYINLIKSYVRFNSLQWTFEFLFGSHSTAVISKNVCVHMSQVAYESLKIFSFVFCSLNMTCLFIWYLFIYIIYFGIYPAWCSLSFLGL